MEVEIKRNQLVLSTSVEVKSTTLAQVQKY